MVDFTVLKRVNKSDLEELEWYEIIENLDNENVLIKVHSNLDKNTLIESIIRKHYNINDELSIQRQRDTNPLEFEEYFNKIEEIKKDINVYIEKRTKDIETFREHEGGVF